LPFCSFLSIGRDVTNPDEDIAISIDVTPGCQTLDVSIVWGRDGLILADDELPLDASSTEGLDEAMAQAAEFLTMHVDVIAEALVSLTDRDEPT
jgi:hypothetical protein